MTMQSFFNEDQIVKILGAACTLYFSEYKNGTIAMEAYDVKHGDLHAVCTVNWEANFRGPDYANTLSFPAVVLKKYSENEGIEKDLENGGVIMKGGAYLEGSNGTVEARLLTPKYQEICKSQIEDQRIAKEQETQFLSKLKSGELDVSAYLIVSLLRPGDKIRMKVIDSTLSLSHKQNGDILILESKNKTLQLLAKTIAEDIEKGNSRLVASPSYKKAECDLPVYLIRELLRPGNKLASQGEICTVYSIRKMDGKIYLRSDSSKQEYNLHTEDLVDALKNGEVVILIDTQQKEERNFKIRI